MHVLSFFWCNWLHNVVLSTQGVLCTIIYNFVEISCSGSLESFLLNFNLKFDQGSFWPWMVLYRSDHYHEIIGKGTFCPSTDCWMDSPAFRLVPVYFFQIPQWFLCCLIILTSSVSLFIFACVHVVLATISSVFPLLHAQHLAVTRDHSSDCMRRYSWTPDTMDHSHNTVSSPIHSG